MSAVWTFLKRVPAWIWLALSTLLSLGGVLHYRKIALTERARRERVVEAAERERTRLGAEAEAARAASEERSDAREAHAAESVAIAGERATTSAAVEAGGEALAARVNELVPPGGS